MFIGRQAKQSLQNNMIESVPLRLDLSQLNKAELKRVLPANDITTGAALAAAKLLRRPVFAPDQYPDALELVVAEEADWDGLGAAIEQAVQARAMRDALHEMGCEQIGAFKLKGLPYGRNFFAYLKPRDTFAALYLSDAGGPAPYLEFFSVFRKAKENKIALVSSSNSLEVLDPSQKLLWLPDPGATPEQLFQLHRGKLLEVSTGNRAALTEEDFRSCYLEIWNENFSNWKTRGLLK